MHFIFFFFNHTATTEIYTLSLHDALPIYASRRHTGVHFTGVRTSISRGCGRAFHRSEEHTSELQSHSDLVCRLLLEKKKNIVIDGSLHVRYLFWPLVNQEYNQFDVLMSDG